MAGFRLVESTSLVDLNQVGKTTTTLDVIKNAQIKFAQDAKRNKTVEKSVLFIDEEGTFDPVWARKFGVDVEKIIYIRPGAAPAEEVFDEMRKYIETDEIGLVILDSVATLVPAQVYDESFEKQSYGGIAKPLTRFLNVINGTIERNKTTVIFINQVRDNVGSLFGGTVTPGGRALKHACTCRFEFRKGKYIDNDGNEISSNSENPAGNIVHMVVLKSKAFNTDRRLGYYTIRYVSGPDLLSDYVEVGKQLGVINQRGAFFDIVDVESGEVLNKSKIQGKAKLREEFVKHPEWYKLISDTLEKKNVEDIVDKDLLNEANTIINTQKES